MINWETVKLFGWLIVALVIMFALAVELQNSLPKMVVEILQERLDRKGIADSIPTTVSQPSFWSLESTVVGHGANSVRCEEGLYEFPKNWEPMNDSEVSC